MFGKFSKVIKDKIDDAKIHYGIGLNQAFNNFSQSVNSLFVDREFFDDDFFDDFEEKLIELDIVPLLAITLREELEKKILNKRVDKDSFEEAMQEIIINTVKLDMDNELVLDPNKLNVLLVVGVNGVGKTTTISKLMHKYKEGFELEVVAADTFRAGAIEQLSIWADKEDVPITKTKQGHAPSAVVHLGIESAVKNNRNLLICDTAGRLHNQEELMQELEKISKVINKYPSMHEDLDKEYEKKTILVLDGTAGKNTIEQARSFNEISDIDGVIITKMDAKAKAGMIINIAYELGKPIYFLAAGEDVESLIRFDYETYVASVLGE